MKSIILIMICLKLISCAVLINDKELIYAEQQTQESYEKLISVLSNPNTSEKEITMRYLNYLDKIRKEAKIRGKIDEWNEVLSDHTISHQGSMETLIIRNHVLNQMQILNKRIDSSR